MTTLRVGARSSALFFAILGSVALLGALRGVSGIETSWIDLRPLGALGPLFLMGFTGACAALASGRFGHGPVRAFIVLVALAAAIIALKDGVTSLVLNATGRVALGAMPLSFATAGLLLLMALVPPRKSRTSRRESLGVCAAAAVLGLIFPLGQVLTFGQTDYRRPAAAAVVLGARAYADGRPSRALAERVRTACALYHEGLVPQLVMSGGPGDGATHETEAMRNLAMQEGVPEKDILLDRSGLDTRATLAFVRREFGSRRCLFVSHDFHLARIKLSARLAGLRVLTVPAKTEEDLPRRRFLLARETAAYWFYLGRGLCSMS